MFKTINAIAPANRKEGVVHFYWVGKKVFYCTLELALQTTKCNELVEGIFDVSSRVFSKLTRMIDELSNPAREILFPELIRY